MSASLGPIDENEVMSQQEVVIQMPPLSQSQPPLPSPPLRWPSTHLLADDQRAKYLEICVPLYEASITGDWKAAQVIIDKQQDVVRCSITENYETALHIAASAKPTKSVEDFVENLVKLMNKEDLELQNKNANTALCLAAAAGSVKIANIMVNKSRALLTIPGSQQMMPLYMASLFGNHQMVKYLYDNSQKMSGDFWTHQSRGWVLLKCVEVDLFDIALQIVKDRPELATNGTVLGILARKPKALKGVKPFFVLRMINSIFSVCGLNVEFPKKESEAFQLLRIIWGNIVKLPKADIDTILRGPADPTEKTKKPTSSEKEDQALQLLKFISTNVEKIAVGDKKMIVAPTISLKGDAKATTSKDKKKKYSSRILFVAVKMGNKRFILELLRSYPDLIWKVNDNNQSIFHIAVKRRHEKIYNLLYEIGSMKDLITPLKDGNDNNMLHLVGESAKRKRLQDVSGVALQMQRELLWFKEVEKMIPPSYRERKNKDGQTPHDLFTAKHKDLVTEGEEWMKGTAAQCMVVATLIATIVFAAAFTVPGGYNQNYGSPMYYRKLNFKLFVITDALSLFSSSASILMFLSILTSRYAEHDFLGSLPKKLMWGLATLFLSITTMMMAFSVSFFVLYHKNLKWIPVTVSLFAGFPVIQFASLQFPLLRDVYRSTYGSRYLFKPNKPILYKQKRDVTQLKVSFKDLQALKGLVTKIICS